MSLYISSVNYKSISDLISNIYDRVTYINESLESMAADLYSSNVSISDIGKRRFYNLIREEKTTIYNKSFNSLDTLSFVKKLQDHVYSNYGDINIYLSENGTKVTQTFADLSAEVGYTINPENIGVVS